MVAHPSTWEAAGSEIQNHPWLHSPMYTAGNQTQVLRKSSVCFLCLSHLSSPYLTLWLPSCPAEFCVRLYFALRFSSSIYTEISFPFHASLWLYRLVNLLSILSFCVQSESNIPMQVSFSTGKARIHEFWMELIEINHACINSAMISNRCFS